MRSNEYIKLTNIETREDFECPPNQEFIPPRGRFKLWNNASILDDNNQLIIQLNVIDFKDGAELPAILFPTPEVKAKKKPKVEVNENDEL